MPVISQRGDRARAVGIPSCCLLSACCVSTVPWLHGKAAPQSPPRDNRPALPSLLLLLSAAC